MADILHNIQTKLRAETINEYNLMGYVPTHGNDIGLEGNIKLNGDTLSKLENELNSIKYHYTQKDSMNIKKNNNSTSGTITSQTLISDPDIFNIVMSKNEDNETMEDKKIEWRKLSKEEQFKHLDDFFKHQNEHHLLNIGQPPFDEKVMEEVKGMIEEGKLYLKKDIDWDSLNGRISNIPLIKYHSTSKSYTIGNIGNKKNVKKISQNAVNKLMKKK